MKLLISKLRHSARQNRSWVLAVAALAYCGTASAADRVYSLVSYNFEDPMFGISGTIRTDGSLGYLSDTSFMKDWSILVRTPSEAGSVVHELFTAALGSKFSKASFFVTDFDILLLPTQGPVFSFGQFLFFGKDSRTSSILWRSGHRDEVFPLSPSVRVCGAGDASPCATATVYGAAQVATGGEPVPEPASFAALLVGALLILASRRAQVALVALLLVVNVSPVHADLPMTGMYVPELQAVDTLLQDFMAGKPIPGGTLAITHNDRVIYERGFGYSDAAKTNPMQETALMRLASVSKPVTASAIHQLAKEGQLDLDAKAFNINSNGGILNITPFNGVLGDSRLQDITLQHLLEHKGGWNRDTVGDLAFQDIQIANAMGGPSPPGIAMSAEYILSRPLQFTPGADYNYSNIGYMFLGMVVEKVSGESYESYVDRAVLAPAGIPDWEVDGGRTFAADQNPREPYYSAPNNTTRNVYDPNGPRVPWPYGGWDHEKALAYGGLIASSKAIALLAQNRIVAGPEIGKLRSDFTTYPEYWWGHGGLLDGTDAAVIQSSTNDWTYSILLDRRPTNDSSYSAVLVESLQGILDGLGAWPAPLVYAADFTNDQWLTRDDIALFKHAVALGSEAVFSMAFPTARYAAGDFDGDGQVMESDMAGMIDALQHAGMPAELVALVQDFPGDYNVDGVVDAADYTVWRDGLGTLYSQGHYNIWRAHFGTSLSFENNSMLSSIEPPSSFVPEPSTLALFVLAVPGCYGRRTHRMLLKLRNMSVARTTLY